MRVLEMISRNEARLQGRLRFYTGRPCMHGHMCERYVSTGGCITCLDPVWRSVRAQIGEDVFKIHLRIPATTTPERRAALAQWIQDVCVPAFYNPPEVKSST